MGKINLGHDQSPPGDCSKDADDASEITLNYAFAQPSGGNLSPLPLTISRRLLEGPSAKLRPIIIDTLGTEGITVRLGDIRFWRTRLPLESRIAVNGVKSWIQEFSSGEQVPVGIPFTETMSMALGEWISDDRLVHLIVTSGDIPFSVKSEPLDSESCPGPPQISFPTIAFGKYDLGYYPGRKDGGEVKEGERHSKDIVLTPNDSTIASTIENTTNFMGPAPAVLLGISRLSASAFNDELQVMTHVSDFHANGFRVHFDAFGRTILFNGWLSWMAISLHHPCPLSVGNIMQWGTVDSQSSHPRKVGRRSATLRVPFHQAYQQTPTIFSCLSGFTIGGATSIHWDIRTLVTG